MTLLCERCGAEVSDPLATADMVADPLLCPSCAKRAGAGQGDGQAVLTAARGCRDMLRESAKQFRLLGDQGHAKMADIHAEQACAAIPQLEALLAERAEMVAVLHRILGFLPRHDEFGEAAFQAGNALLAKLEGGNP